MAKKPLIIIAIFTCFLSLGIFAAEAVPAVDQINQTLTSEYMKYKNVSGGKNADYIPELAKVDPKLFGIVIMTVDGKMYSIGNSDVPFAIESVSKPFIYALALQDNGEELMTEKVGLNATGHEFNSIKALDDHPNHLQNPLVNAGAILMTSLIKGDDSANKWERALTFFKKLSDDKVFFGNAVYQSEMATNQRNQAIAQLLSSYGLLTGDVHDAVDRYTKACSIMVTAKELAIMGATLANNGVNPITHQQVISPHYVRDVLSQMTISGMYENSGAWWFTVGLPAKSGVSGDIVAVVPGKMAIVVFSPPVDASGNSVRGQEVLTDISKQWKLHLLGE
jgi:glutaminase